MVSHHAERTGAAIVLRDLLRAGMLSGFEVEIVLLEGGPLTDDFKQLGSTSLRRPHPRRRFERVIRRLPFPIRQPARVALQRWLAYRLRRRIGQPDVLYLNTVVAGAAVRALHARPPTVVSHVHELATALDMFATEAREAADADAIVAVSEPVREELLTRGVGAERIAIVHESIPTDSWPRTSKESRITARRTLGITEDAFVVVAAGTVDERKGADLFVETARVLLPYCPQHHFVWCGKVTNLAYMKRLQGDTARHGLSDRVCFLGEMDTPLLAYQAADVFFLPSREDPFPLVCLEAAGTGLPIVAYVGGGGMPAFVEDDAGVVVNELTGEAFAEALHQLAADPALLRRFGETAAAKVRSRHDVDVAARLIRQVIARTSSSSTVRRESKKTSS